MVKALSSSEDLKCSDYWKMYLSLTKLLPHLSNIPTNILAKRVCPPMKSFFFGKNPPNTLGGQHHIH